MKCQLEVRILFVFHWDLVEVPFPNVWVSCCQGKLRKDPLYLDEDRQSNMLLCFELMLPVATCGGNKFKSDLFQESENPWLFLLTQYFTGFPICQISQKC
mmetsp:Transcript_52053/g.59039  ORF Transcript_52053/g.59039 Transcript_52053/m.59039 type:complete len:100 (-) Transcript_52053:486-785(-)